MGEDFIDHIYGDNLADCQLFQRTAVHCFIVRHSSQPILYLLFIEFLDSGLLFSFFSIQSVEHKRIVKRTRRIFESNGNYRK